MHPAVFRLRRHALTFLLPALLLLGSALALAPAARARQGGGGRGGYPAARERYVNDYAGVLAPDQERAVRATLADLRRARGIEATVLTVRSIRDYSTGDQTMESFATNLFNTWGIGDRDRDDGVLVLVAVKDRKMRVEVGDGYGRAYDGAMQRVIDADFLPFFKRDEYGRGIVNGTRAVVRALPATWPPPTTAAKPGTSPPGSAGTDDASPEPLVLPETEAPPADFAIGDAPYEEDSPLPLVGGAAGVATVGGLAGYGVYRYRRFRRRRCPSCRTDMARLVEYADDAFLDEGQRREEDLRSVDYDIWQCPSCGFHHRYGYSAWLSAYQRCDRCRYRTLSVNQQTISAPTQHSTGTARVTSDCRHCRYHGVRHVTLPRLPKPSSGSSSSSRFGGGSSSGGGASGSW
ncbi:MAG TPA: TPM domain-containing protein [Armatimonadaceae bacterium]|nr:TPM domain-containing protein [Armatimonadaceae bacterium]